MARSMVRTNQNQVAPDVMLGRRFQWKVSVDVPLDQTQEHWPLYGSRDDPSIWSQVGRMRVEGPAQGHDAPVIAWDRRVFHPGRGGGSAPRKGQTRVNLFTATTKMACPSFGLPAGPPNEGGTCVAATHPKGGGGLREKGKVYTCDSCYSLEGNYWMQEPAVAQAARLHWLIERLKEDGTGSALAQDLVHGIVDYARFCTMRKSRDGALVRLASELGTWRKGRIVVPIAESGGGRAPVYYREAFTTLLPEESGFADSRELVRSLGPGEGDVAGFFRIHDSGDVTVLNRPTLWASYVRAWGMVAKALPSVFFWLPTRAWAFTSLQPVLAEVAAEAPKNLVIRPSAYHVGDPAPVAAGMHAGTTVIPKPEKGAVRGVAIEGVYPCPVYMPRWDPNAIPRTKARRASGAMGEWVEDRSCQTAGCRMCWAGALTPVAYGFH